MFKNIYTKLITIFLILEFIGISALYYYNYYIFKSTVINFESSFTKSYNQLQNTFIRNSIIEAKKNLEIIINTNSFTDRSDENILKIQQLFYDLISTRSDLLQIRFFDNQAREVIKVQKYDEDIIAISSNIHILQNEKTRNYFEKTMKLKANEYFISNFDLNIEFDEIEYPYRPTLRVATPIIYINERVGVLIINIKMDKYLDIFEKLDNFNIFLIDKNGHYLLHPNKDKRWSSALGLPYKLNDDFSPETVKNILENDFYSEDFLYSYSLEDLFMNNQNLKIIFKIKDKYLNESLFDKNLKFLKTIIIFNLVIGLFYFAFYSQINKKLKREIIKNDENNKIIDRYVAISITNIKGEMIYVSDAFCKLTGYTKNELIGKNHSVLKSSSNNLDIYKDLWETITKGDIWEGEIENVKKNGEKYWIELLVYPKVNPYNLETEYMSIAYNITDRKLIEKIANTDHLTNLANRKKINNEIENAIYNIRRYNYEYSLMLIDIDHFKEVNDTYGHNIGDSVLIEMARILENKTRKTDIIGRWGGEEFIILASNLSLDDCYSLAEHIRKEVEVYNFKSVGHKTISIGISQIYNDDSIKSCVERADKNLYEAKNSGRNRVVS